MSEYSLFTSESVSEGHPDKIADQISDAVLDAIIVQDKHARVAVETLVKTGVVIVAGEVTTSARVDLERPRRVYDEVMSEVDGAAPLDAILYFEFRTYLQGLLVLEDKLSGVGGERG